MCAFIFNENFSILDVRLVKDKQLCLLLAKLERITRPYLDPLAKATLMCFALDLVFRKSTNGEFTVSFDS